MPRNNFQFKEGEIAKKGMDLVKKVGAKKRRIAPENRYF